MSTAHWTGGAIDLSFIIIIIDATENCLTATNPPPDTETDGP